MASRMSGVASQPNPGIQLGHQRRDEKSEHDPCPDQQVMDSTPFELAMETRHIFAMVLIGGIGHGRLQGS